MQKNCNVQKLLPLLIPCNHIRWLIFITNINTVKLSKHVNTIRHLQRKMDVKNKQMNVIVENKLSTIFHGLYSYQP